MSNLNQEFVDNIVQQCFNTYSRLPKTGEPIEKEWTVLSCMVLYNKTSKDIEVVSLGTGSKCVGASKMSATGDIINDSHAEVFSRRGFLIYLYEHIEKALKDESSIFNYINSQQNLQLKDNIEFVFYSSQLPCGDASIIPKSGEEELYGEVVKSLKRAMENDEKQEIIKKQKLEHDIYRTGAKCLPHCGQDPKVPGKKYHLLGQVRTKPGRGDRTLSLSCTDKIAKWIHLGIQGSLLDMLCEPIYIKHFIFGAGVPYSEDSLKRALLNRQSDSSTNVDVIPIFYQSSLAFLNIKSEENVRAAPGSIIWVNTRIQLHEVAVQGRKLGVTKKKAACPQNSLCISKYNIYKKLLIVLKNNSDLKLRFCGQDNIEEIPYNKMKRKSKRYIEKWLDVKQNFFCAWTVKPDMWDFCVTF